MHLHRVALIVVIAAIACEVSWADTQYEMMDTYMQDYNRAKRSVENMEIQPGEETKQITKRDGDFDYSTLMDPTMMDTTMMNSMMTESHDQPQKRQLYGGRRYNPLSYGYNPYNRLRYQGYRGYPQIYGGYPGVNYSPLSYGRLNRYPYYY